MTWTAGDRPYPTTVYPAEAYPGGYDGGRTFRDVGDQGRWAKIAEVVTKTTAVMVGFLWVEVF